MIKVNVILASLILCFNCIGQKEIIKVDGYTFEAFAGPNMVRISNNFYADHTEIWNTAYKEYLYWTKTVYGVNSQEYINALPDASVWQFQNKTGIKHDEYFWSPEFDEFPLVGITLEQAKIYSTWRTDRVAEMLMIEKGYLNTNLNANPTNVFSIEKYKNGEIELEKELDSFFVYPNFTIPTIEEWETLSGINTEFKYGINSSSDHNKMYMKKGEIFNAHHDFKSVPLKSCKHGIKNIYGLYHTIGNVSELVDDNGITKGGNWKNITKDFDPSQNLKQNIPNCWTGFRNISRLQVLEKL